VPITLTFADATPKRSRLWVGSTGYNRIGYVDLQTTAEDINLTISKSTQLDNPVQQIFQMYNPTTGISKVIVTHDQVGGAVTLVDGTNPERSKAQKLEGFLLSDLL
jgi:hypothetical protein